MSIEKAALQRWMVAVLCGWASIVCLGCGSGHPKTVRATGSVVYKGQPVDGAQVIFYGTKGRPAEAVTDTAGHFTLGTFRAGDGALVGDHTVTISKVVRMGNAAEKAAEDPHAPPTSLHGASAMSQQAIPTRYAAPSKSPLRATVTADGDNDFTFELTD